MPFKRNYRGKRNVPHKLYSFNLPETLVSEIDTLPVNLYRTQRVIAACENYIADVQADVDNSVLLELMQD